MPSRNLSLELSFQNEIIASGDKRLIKQDQLPVKDEAHVV